MTPEQARKEEREAIGWRAIEPLLTASDGHSYMVSEDGRVTRNGILRRQYLNSKGYCMVTMASRTTAVHRLVATAFIPNPMDYREVNHLNGVKTDNNVSNLEWCDRLMNVRHAFATGLVTKYSGAEHWASKPVRAVFPDGSFRDFDYIMIAKEAGFSPSCISMCVNGARKTHGGATWNLRGDHRGGKDGK